MPSLELAAGSFRVKHAASYAVAPKRSGAALPRGRAAGTSAWTAPIGPTSEVPTALDSAPRAKAMCTILGSQNRFAVLYRIDSAKRPGNRARRIEQHVAMLELDETIYPQKRTLDP